MNIHEYQAKQILNRYGINIPKGSIAYTPAEAKRVAQKISPRGPWMLKAQIQSGARASGKFKEKSAGKLGGIRYITGRKDIFEEAEKMLGATLVTKQTGEKGKSVSKIYVEEHLAVKQTFYISFVIDRMVPCVTLLVADETENIVDVVINKPEDILRLNLSLNAKISSEQIHQIMNFLKLDSEYYKNLKSFINGVYKAFIDLDATMIEINPVGIDTKGNLFALDAKISFDDNALYRHHEIAKLHDDYEYEDRVLKASKYGFQYREFGNGSIGCIVNGEGIALSIRDMLFNDSEKMDCFLNVKGGVDKDKISAGIKIIMTNPKVEGILINILGGFLRCNLVADGILAATSEVGLNVPLVVRFEGTNKDEAKDILRNSNLPILMADTVEEGVAKLLKAMEESNKCQFC